MSEPTFACVKVGTKYTDDYVRKLRASIARNCSVPHKFICFTDAPIDGVECELLTAGLPGWWSKVELFRFGRDLIYFDLDVVITGDLAPLLEWRGFGIIDDWVLSGFNSSVMRITPDERHVWEKFQPRFMRMVPGDQDYITGVIPEARTFPPEWFPSYKANGCFYGPPDGALAVVLTGFPKPHQLGGWIKELWTDTKD